MSISDKFFDEVSQASHVLASATVMLVTFVFGGPKALLIAVPIWIAMTAFKEFWYDNVYETPEEAGPSGWEDFGFYMAGMVTTILVLWAGGKLS